MTRQNTTQEIALLLEKFMAGETSVNEEQTLAQYFRTHEVSEEWLEYKEMFALFDKGEVDVSVRPDSSDVPFVAEEGKVRLLPKPVREKPKIWSMGWLLTGAAACVILVVGLFLPKEKEITDAETTVVAQVIPEEADAPEVQQDTVKEELPIEPTLQPVIAKQTLAQKSDKVSPAPSAVEEISELTDEQIMANYIADNFMTLEERQQMMVEEEVIKEVLDRNLETKEYINDIGQIFDYEYDL